MRIISQDETIDVPYEMVVIKRLGNAVYFLNRNLTGAENWARDIELAKYSTEEKAKKAMEMLRNKYREYISTNYSKVFQFPAEEELE